MKDVAEEGNPLEPMVHFSWFLPSLENNFANNDG